MAPVAIESNDAQEKPTTHGLKAKNGDAFNTSDLRNDLPSFNPFYSPPGDTVADDEYEYDRYRVRSPVIYPDINCRND